jgi:hypothetical protein
MGDKDKRLHISEHPMCTIPKLLRENGFSFKSEGWLDEPLYRNVDIYKKKGVESSLMVSYRNHKAYYLDNSVGVNGHFKPLNKNSIKNFEVNFK